MKYEVKEKDKFKFISLILLNQMIQFQQYFPEKVTGNDTFLGQYLEQMKLKGVIEVKDKKYIPTAKGREELVNLYAKFYEYLKMFDIYCAVDLDKGEFAFSQINSDMDDEQWSKFLNDSRFSDVRVAVSEFKGIDAMEVVFMSFLNENRFECKADKWQYELTGYSVWTEIEQILNTAVSSDYLKENGTLENVIKQGTEIAMKLIKDAEDSENNSDEPEVITETITTEETTEENEEYVDVVPMPYYNYGYWDPYYDPYYISPLWLVPAVLLF